MRLIPAADGTAARIFQPSERIRFSGRIGTWQELKPADSQHVLAAFITGLFILPVLAFDVAINHDAITFFAAVNYHLRAFSPNFNIDYVVNVIAILILTFLNTSGEISNLCAAIK